MSDVGAPTSLLGDASFPAKIAVVTGFGALRQVRFGPICNAACWQRRLVGDYQELVAACKPGPGITMLDPSQLRRLRASAAAMQAREQVLADWELLADAGLDPALEIVNGYLEADSDDALPTHVRSFHVDRADLPVDTWICTYTGAPTEGLYNEDSVRHVDVVITREKLRAQYAGDEAGFAGWLAAKHFDLHYAAKQGARSWSFGCGNLWRIACDYPGSEALPCIHRAPAHGPTAEPRLLLLA